MIGNFEPAGLCSFISKRVDAHLVQVELAILGVSRVVNREVAAVTAAATPILWAFDFADIRAYAPPIAPHWAIGVSSPDTTRRSSALSTKSALFLRPASRFMAAGAGTPQGVPVPSVRSANPASAASQRLAAPQAAPVLDTRSSS